MTPTLLIILALTAPLQTTDCKEWHECQKMALEAAERQDYNAFHDLSWRALQTGPKNDPALMTMLARAQSLSGRPGDALVMLQRLAAMGVTTDAATSDDFRFVRALPGWADFEARLSGMPAPTPSTVVPSPEAKRPDAAAASKRGTPATKPPKGELAKTEPPKPDTVTPESPKPEPAPASEAKLAGPRTGPLVFSAPGLTAVGLGYDAVSGRFIVGDRTDRRLLVVGERSGRLASLAGVDAGFDDVSAFEIDAAEGDLWVTSASNQSRSSTLHKLQLISGRVLASIALPPAEGPARFTDVAVTPQSILVLDAEGRRVYRVAKKGRALDLVTRIAVPDSTSLAPGPEGIAYAAYDRGVIRIDLATRALTVVDPSADVDLSGLRWMRWHRGSLVAIQGRATGPFRLLRIRLDDAGRRARAIEVLDANVSLAGPTSAALAGNAVYYLSPAADDQVEVRKLTLK